MPGTKTNREWTEALEYTKDRDGNPCPVNNVGNLVTILENDERLRGKIRYNDFSSIIEHDELPWNGKGEWVDDDNAELRFLLEDFRRSGFQKDKVMDALAIVAKKHRYHPIREYLDALEWDDIPRIETLFIDYFHTDDIPLYRNASICFFAKAVQRIYEPGCDLQFMLEFLGPQGTGKSAFGKALVGNKWFNDSDIDVGSKDGYMALANSWLIEIAEGDSFNKKEASAVKKFISSTSDTYRPPYARSNVVIQRQCVFIGTTNEEVFLNDPTGNRRFWPIETKATAIDAVKRIKWLESIADQLWAEAVVIYFTRMSEIDQLVIDTGHQMMELQEQHNQIDPLLDDLQEFLETKLPSCWDKLSTYEKRNFYDSNEAGREDLYMPIAWKGNVEQYAGRLHREYAGKNEVRIYDYVDVHVPLCDSMYRKRLKGYLRAGYGKYVTSSTLDKNPQELIYERNNYEATFRNDLAKAQYSVIIAVPKIKFKYKPVIMSTLANIIHNGVTVAVHIKEEGANEIELKNTGMDVVCNKEQTLQCAIIDKSIVWYGNINFFGYNSETNNVMRIADHKIANEMIEILYSDTANDVNGG